MSFSGTPLGQGRRLDRDTFLGKPNPKESKPGIIPASYDFSALVGSRSPPKPSSPTREGYTELAPRSTQNEPALARFARQKQREAELALRPGAPKIATVNPTPSKWAVKDTTVNIANAFTIEAAKNNGEVMGVTAQNPNNSWASSSRTQSHVPRSTSVEYEEQTRTAQARRLPVPGNRIPQRGGSSNTLKPPSKTRSLQHVPDSEGEEIGPNGRATSPYQAVIAAAKRALAPALAPAAFYVRERTPEADQSGEQPSMNGSAQGNDSTYNYEDEERFVQDAMQAAKSERRTNHKRGRISKDNQAYKPALSDEESSEEDDDDRRPKKGKIKPVGRVTNLPTVADGKTTKKRRTKNKGNTGGPEDDISEDISNTDILSQSAASGHRASVPRTILRLSAEPPNASIDDHSLSLTEAGLQSIPEVPEEEVPQKPQLKAQGSEKPRSGRPRRNSRASTPARTQRFSIGSVLGKLVNVVVSLLLNILLVISSVFGSFGRVVGKTVKVLSRPMRWVKGKPGLFATLAKYLLIGFTILSAWYMLKNPTFQSYLPSLPSFPSNHSPVYTPPQAPPQDISELVARLTRMEYALSGLTVESERMKVKTDESAKDYSELNNKLGQVEGKLSAESRRISDAESSARDSISKNFNSLLKEVEGLQAQIQAHKKQYEKEKGRPSTGSDEEARAKLKGLEDRLATAESGVKEALELGKKLASTPAATPAVPDSAWWNKIISSSKGRVQITTPDGKDVTGLISELVDTSVARAMNDRNNKVDYALHSGGARVIPSLTSATFEIKPNGVKGQVLGILTGNGHAIGRPPVTALHHELHNGHCWPFTGAEGQLGVALAAPAYVDEITVDHVAKDVAFDMRSAPRQMEVWGLVEGVDNLEKIKTWKKEKLFSRKVAAEASGQVVDAAWEKKDLAEEMAAYPPGLPKNTEYIRLASFMYDIHASDNIQTFPVDPEIRKLGIDFGVVALRVLNNWGRDEYTCLYRFRVHGRRFGELPPPYSQPQLSS